MKTIVIVVLGLAAAVAGEKVSICHVPPGERQGKVMLVPPQALAGHLGHGDFLSFTCE